MPGSGVRVSPQLLPPKRKSPANNGGAFTSYRLEAGQNHKLVAPILRPTVLVTAGGACRTLLAEGDDFESRGVDSAIRQITGHDRRALLAQCQVVLVGAAVVRVALDTYANARVPLQCVDLLVE